MNNDERTFIAHWMYQNQSNYQIIGLRNVYVLKFRTLDVTKDTYRLLYEDGFSYVVKIKIGYETHVNASIPFKYYDFNQINSDGSLTHLYDTENEDYDKLKKIIKLRKLKNILS
jgi:hypothetical protein